MVTFVANCDVSPPGSETRVTSAGSLTGTESVVAIPAPRRDTSRIARPLQVAVLLAAVVAVGASSRTAAWPANEQVVWTESGGVFASDASGGGVHRVTSFDNGWGHDEFNAIASATDGELAYTFRISDSHPLVTFVSESLA